MSYRHTRAQSMDNPTPDQSQKIQDLITLVREESSQIQHLLNLQNPKNPPPQPRQPNPQATYERFLNLHPTKFQGGPDPTIAEEWIKSLEVIFGYVEMNDRDRFYCALFLLKNEARHWWEGTKTGVDLGNTTWEKFKQLFFEKYFSKNVRAQKLKEFLDLKQGGSPVAKYSRRFEQGCLYEIFITREENEKIDHSLHRLHPLIRRDVHLTVAATFREIVDPALGAEPDELETLQMRASQSTSTRPWKKPNMAQAKGKQVVRTKKPVCPKCKREERA